MQNNYILKTKKSEILSFYYGSERAIYCKKLDSNNYPITSKVIEDVTDYFTVSLDKNDNIYIFCQNLYGDIILCKLEENTFKNKVVFKNTNGDQQNVIFKPIFFNDNMSIIYNVPIKNSKDEFLSVKTLVGGKSWTNSENIDTFSPFLNNLFHVQIVNEDNLILAYQKVGRDIQIGYKEIKNGNIYDFIVFHKTGYNIVDYSFLAYKETVHFIYIVKNLFSSQVIYRRKDINGLSNPIVLFEGQKIKSCTLSILENKLYAMFIVNNILYYSQSEDLGLSFLGVSKYRRTITQDVGKAIFISNQNIGDSCLNEIYLDTKNTLNISFLPEFSTGIFNKKSINLNREYITDIGNEKNNETNNKFISNLNNQISKPQLDKDCIKEEISSEENRESEKYNKIQSSIPLENNFMANFDLNKFNDYKLDLNSISDIKDNNLPDDNNLLIIQNKLKMLSEQLNDKNSQILQLNNIIQTKNNEKIEIEIDLRQKIKRFNEENKILLKEKNDLIEKINTLEEELKNHKIKSNESESEDLEYDRKHISNDTGNLQED